MCDMRMSSISCGVCMVDHCSLLVVQDILPFLDISLLPLNYSPTVQLALASSLRGL